MRKIALISEHASPLALAGGVDAGGQNIYVANVARHLARLGHQVDVFTRRDKSVLPTVFKWRDGVRVIHVPAGPPSFVPKEDLLPYMDAFGDFMLDFFQAQNQPYDLVHANFFMSGLAGLKVKEVLGVPLVMTFHALGRIRRLYQQEADRFPDSRFEIEDLLMHGSDRIVAECPQDRIDMLEHYGADDARIDIVPCGFDSDELAPITRKEARQKLGWADDEFAVLQLGRLVPRKGIANVIQGIAALKRRHGTRVRLYVVGGNSEQPNPAATPEIGRLMQLAQAEGVADQVVFVGRRARSDLQWFYSAADVFVTTPWYEPFGITPVEAMACGTPVIGSAVGGVKHTVVDGETGYLVPPNDPDALADCLARFTRDRGLAARMGEAGRQRANAQFTWRQVAKGLAGVYERVLEPATAEHAMQADAGQAMPRAAQRFAMEGLA
jgi:D-inositol-3-phosphate glycosyltransferase